MTTEKQREARDRAREAAVYGAAFVRERNFRMTHGRQNPCDRAISAHRTAESAVEDYVYAKEHTKGIPG